MPALPRSVFGAFAPLQDGLTRHPRWDRQIEALMVAGLGLYVRGRAP